MDYVEVQQIRSVYTKGCILNLYYDDDNSDLFYATDNNGMLELGKLRGVDEKEHILNVIIGDGNEVFFDDIEHSLKILCATHNTLVFNAEISENVENWVNTYRPDSQLTLFKRDDYLSYFRIRAWNSFITHMREQNDFIPYENTLLFFTEGQFPLTVPLMSFLPAKLVDDSNVNTNGYTDNALDVPNPTSTTINDKTHIYIDHNPQKILKASRGGITAYNPLTETSTEPFIDAMTKAAIRSGIMTAIMHITNQTTETKAALEIMPQIALSAATGAHKHLMNRLSNVRTPKRKSKKKKVPEFKATINFSGAEVCLPNWFAYQNAALSVPSVLIGTTGENSQTKQLFTAVVDILSASDEEVPIRKTFYAAMCACLALPYSEKYGFVGQQIVLGESYKTKTLAARTSNTYSLGMLYHNLVMNAIDTTFHCILTYCDPYISFNADSVFSLVLLKLARGELDDEPHFVIAEKNTFSKITIGLNGDGNESTDRYFPVWSDGNDDVKGVLNNFAVLFRNDTDNTTYHIKKVEFIPEIKPVRPRSKKGRYVKVTSTKSPPEEIKFSYTVVRGNANEDHFKYNGVSPSKFTSNQTECTVTFNNFKHGKTERETFHSRMEFEKSHRILFAPTENGTLYEPFMDTDECENAWENDSDEFDQDVIEKMVFKKDAMIAKRPDKELKLLGRNDSE